MEWRKSNKSAGKLNRRRRRRRRRKPPQDRFINVAEARREIVHFLHLHRSPPPSSSSSSNWDPPVNAIEGNITSTFNLSRNNIVSESSHHQPLICYPLIESLPLPGPTWSTTAPSVLAPPPPPPIETLEIFEFPQNLSSSYTWWIDFLNGLDCKKSSVVATDRDDDEVSKYPAFGEITGYNGKGVFGQWLNVGGDHHRSSSFLGNDDDDDQISSSPDEWLTVPPSEDQG